MGCVCPEAEAFLVITTMIKPETSRIFISIFLIYSKGTEFVQDLSENPEVFDFRFALNVPTEINLSHIPARELFGYWVFQPQKRVGIRNGAEVKYRASSRSIMKRPRRSVNEH